MSDDPRIIVRLEEQPGAVIIHLDDGEVLTVAPDAVPLDLPNPGGSVGSPLLRSLRSAAARKLAARALLALLDRKRWTTVRLRGKLLAQGHPEAAVESVLAQAQAQGLHHDRDFADAFCRDALRRKAVGRRWLEARLRERGVAADLAEGVASDQLPAEVERELARRAAAERWRREQGTDRRALARVQRFLVSRGFASGLATSVAIATRPGSDTDPTCVSDDQGPS